eukprot:288081-Amphidinium_carterae.1
MLKIWSTLCYIALTGTKKGEKPAFLNTQRWRLPACACMDFFRPRGLGSCRSKNLNWSIEMESVLCGLMDQENTAVTPTFVDVELDMSLTLASAVGSPFLAYDNRSLERNS